MCLTIRDGLNSNVNLNICKIAEFVTTHWNLKQCFCYFTFCYTVEKFRDLWITFWNIKWTNFPVSNRRSQIIGIYPKSAICTCDRGGEELVQYPVHFLCVHNHVETLTASLFHKASTYGCESLHFLPPKPKLWSHAGWYCSLLSLTETALN